MFLKQWISSVWLFQVKVLQLENQLEQERVRLGELRKRHYELGGPETASEGAEDGPDSFPPPPPPTLLPDSSAGSQPFSSTQPYLNTQSVTQPSNPFLAATSSQPFTLPQSYTPTSTYSQTQAYTPAQTYTPPQSYTPAQTYTTPQSYTPPQIYTPPQSYTPSQPLIPSQPYTTIPSQSYLKPQSQPSSSTAGASRPHSPSHKNPQSSSEGVKSASRKSNIFVKSGNLLKNAVSAKTCSN